MLYANSLSMEEFKICHLICSVCDYLTVQKCAMRTPPTNGYIISGVCPTYYGASCMLGCNTGYQLSNTSSNGQIVCDVDANGVPGWSGLGLSCRRKQSCHFNPLPHNAAFWHTKDI